MKTKLRFWIKPNGTRWLRMTLIGGGWPAGWAVEYAHLEAAELLVWFEQPPAEAEGLRSDRRYQMSDGPFPAEFAGFIADLHTLISQVRPLSTPEASLIIEDEREYE